LEIDLAVVGARDVFLIECKYAERPSVKFPRAVLAKVFPGKRLHYLVACRMGLVSPAELADATLFNPFTGCRKARQGRGGRSNSSGSALRCQGL